MLTPPINEIKQAHHYRTDEYDFDGRPFGVIMNKHLPVIIALSRGIPCQFSHNGVKWNDMDPSLVHSYKWYDDSYYRITPPAPKKDVVKYVGVGVEAEDPAVRLTAAYNKLENLKQLKQIEGPNGGIYKINSHLKLTIDGESRKVIAVDIINND